MAKPWPGQLGFRGKAYWLEVAPYQQAPASPTRASSRGGRPVGLAVFWAAADRPEPRNSGIWPQSLLGGSEKEPAELTGAKAAWAWIAASGLEGHFDRFLSVRSESWSFLYLCRGSAVDICV